jgi:Uma2 family endonuclease
MHVEPSTPIPTSPHEPDQRVFLRGLSWADFERVVVMRGGSGPRLTFLEGALELMSPSREHERLKSLLARLLEAYAEDRDLRLDAYGSWLLRKQGAQCGIEPDECYVLGDHQVSVPDLAIEIVWTSGGLDKLEAYARVGVGEVWFWRGGVIEVYALAERGYERRGRSPLLPDLDLALMAGLLDAADQTRAVTAWRRALARLRP